MNRLGREQSPYLLQHANNPVDWYPWGDEAFARARADDKPIFLSIGYSTCHWCHVMEHESFEQSEAAALLNRDFVPVKVDREERPDVDRVYMTFVQGTTGSGGWPMSVFLTPDLKPFFGGTYFPPVSRWGRPGFIDLLRQIAQVWKTDRSKIMQSADSVTEQLRGSVHATVSADVPSPAVLPRITEAFRASFDARHGGFGEAPKFPRPSELLFLLREHARTGDGDALSMTLATLRAVSLGGMRDHVGGGFHRYSVDAAWRVPHFEKMLYDQAQLALALVEASQASGDRFFLDVAEDTLEYVRREMTGPEGGFSSAEDADSVPPEDASDGQAHKTEGAFYLWTAAEIDVLAGPAAPIVKARFGIQESGNAPADPQGEFTGKNLLYVARGVDDLARAFGKTPREVEEALASVRLAMFEARMGRPRPHLDDKVITAWNGLMIAACARFARARRVVDASGPAAAAPFLAAAQRTAAFLRARLWNVSSGTLLRRFRGADAGISAYAEDYAYLILGLLELFQTDGDPAWLEWATTLQRRQDELFWDEAHGGWFSTTGSDPSILARMKDDYDGAEPTASSIAAFNLMTLVHLVDDPVWLSRIERTFRLFGERLEQIGRAVPMMAAALSTYTAGILQVVVVGDGGRDELDRVVAQQYRPFTIHVPMSARTAPALAALLPWTASMTSAGGVATAYVCHHFSCERPVTAPDDLADLLEHGARSL